MPKRAGKTLFTDRSQCQGCTSLVSKSESKGEIDIFDMVFSTSYMNSSHSLLELHRIQIFCLSTISTSNMYFFSFFIIVCTSMNVPNVSIYSAIIRAVHEN